ncbi:MULTISPECIES: tRNA lysidine(34) synthetase TilS [Synechococcales]|uniref:tRNA lysidine(34) synthetase TilS n=1 Tax=Synechococcus sp. CS-1325 TaxID=2847979 RepID=UPI00223ACB2B|nr:tRNA lysidine(34) synthetase TilS [Synechococcus sp. CS-1325]
MEAILPPESTGEPGTGHPPKPPWGPLHQKLHQELVHRPSLLPAGERLLLAVSGGQDSMALTRLLLDLSRLHHWELQLWHGNHGWRPEAADQAAELAAWSAQQGLPIHLEQAEPAPGSEAAGRSWRYGRLLHWARQLGSQHVLTGHTATDRAETVLLNLARGTHRRGLCSLRRHRSFGAGRWLVRPLLSLSREETAAFCAAWEVPVWLDSGNDQLRHSRNRIRHQVIPVLEDLHPGASRRISALAERLEQDSLEELLGLALERLVDPAAPKRLSRGALSTCSSSCQDLLLHHWLEQQTGRKLSSRPVELLSQRLRERPEPGSLDVGGGWRLEWQKDTLLLLEPDNRSPATHRHPPPNEDNPSDG